MMTSGRLILLACLALLSTPTAADQSVHQVNPCEAARIRCRPSGEFLEVHYRLRLRNPTDVPAQVVLLRRFGFLGTVRNAAPPLIVSTEQGELRAVVPPGWDGQISVGIRQRIRDVGAAGREAAVPLPPAVSRAVDFDLPGRGTRLEVSPGAVVRRVAERGERSHFRIIPVRGDSLSARWKPRAPDRAPAYTLEEDHRLTIAAPGFSDQVSLRFVLDDPAPEVLTLGLPPSASLVDVRLSGPATWQVRGGRLRILPESRAAHQLRLECLFEGRVTPTPDRGWEVRAPFFGGEGARRYRGSLLVRGGEHELAFTSLEEARQMAAPEGWQLACEFAGRSPDVVVRGTPVEARRRALVLSRYEVSAFKVDGRHRVSLESTGGPPGDLRVLLPAGHVARHAEGAQLRDWSQEGRIVHLQLMGAPGQEIELEMTTEFLLEGRRAFELPPPGVADVTSGEHYAGVTFGQDITLKTTGRDDAWRVAPDRLPEWLRAPDPTIGYHSRESAPPMQLEILPVEPVIRGSVQDHVSVSREGLERETLFLLEIEKRPVDELTAALPAGLAVESVEGPSVEGWEVSRDRRQLTVQFVGPVTGGTHFRLVSRHPSDAERLTLEGIALREAPHLKGWLGISVDFSAAVRPVEDGQMDLSSARTDRAPGFLRAFDIRLLYEFFDSTWALDLVREIVEPVYSAEALNVLAFRAFEATGSVFVRVNVREGGVGGLEIALPPGASSPQITAPDVVLTRWEDGAGHVRFSGPRTGSFTCRVDYHIVTGTERSSVGLGPVRLVGAAEERGVLLLTQARPDVEVALGTRPQELLPTDPEAHYPTWGYRRDQPALAAFGYRGTDWELPVRAEPQPLSETMLRASVPLARLDTLLQRSDETVQHLRLFVSNTNRQFLTVDLDELGPGARLIGTYAYGEPIKPFREGETRLHLPLFTSDKAARVGMSVLDITYAVPQRGRGPLAGRTLALPRLGMNVGRLEWTLRLPEEHRLATVSGSMERPADRPARIPSLTERLLGPALRLLRDQWRLLAVAGICAVVAATVLLLALLIGRRQTLRTKMARGALTAAAVLLILAILAAMLMPALQKARTAARAASETDNLHNLGLAMEMYRGDHDGRYPPNLEALFPEGYLDDRDMLTSPVDGRRVIYTRPAPGAAAKEVVAYYPTHATDGANVLFADGSVQWLDADESGDLVNPRTGDLVARLPRTRRRKPILAARAGKAFAGTGVESEELAEALAVGQQMEQRAGAGGRPEVDRQQIDAALIEANRERIAEAIERYSKERGGRPPESKEDILPYLADRRLQAAVRKVPLFQLPGAKPAEEMGPPARDEQAEMPSGELARKRYGLGLEYVRRGDYAEAEEQFHRAVELDADYEAARKQLDKIQALRTVTEAGEKPAAARPTQVAVRQQELQRLGQSIAEQERTAAEARPPGEGRRERQRARKPTADELLTEPMRPGLAKASLVKQLGGGRSRGALPIEIDFPAVPAAAYRFARPFLGRADAELRFRVVGREIVLALELLLACAALTAYLAVRRRNASGAAAFGAVALLAAAAMAVSATGWLASVPAATVAVMVVCLVGEAAAIVVRRIRSADRSRDATG